MKIFIDPGHGGSDPGATGNGLKEKDLTLKIAKKIKSILKEVATVKMSRTTDKYLSLTQRTNMANKWGADYFLSIHINAGGGTGYEDYIYNQLSDSSQAAKIRNTVHTEIMKWIPEVKNRGKKKANFAVVRQSKMPAVLTENLFIDNKEDAKLLKDGAFLDKLAKGHAYGVAKALGLGTPKENAPNSSKPKPSKPSSSSTPASGRVESKVDELRFYSKPSWKDKDVMGHVDKGIGFPTIIEKLKVGNGYQYEVKNSKGATYYITASSKYVKVVGNKPKKTRKPKTSYKKGNTVTLKKSATHFATGETIANFAKGKKYKIIQVKSDRVLLDGIMSWVEKSDVK